MSTIRGLRPDAAPFVPPTMPPPEPQPHQEDVTAAAANDHYMDYNPYMYDPRSVGGMPPDMGAYYPQHMRNANNAKKGKKKTKKPPASKVTNTANHVQTLVKDSSHSGTIEPKALLAEESAFMAPLRIATGASLPHIKLDQRYGRKGVAASALPQFIVAPVVVNYRPIYFHDVKPGDLLEYHYDLALVLQNIESAHTLTIPFGKEWKQYSAPYAFVHCVEYEKEVKKLVPMAEANCRVEHAYDDDVMKDITELILDVEELEFLRSVPLYQAFSTRTDLSVLYAACFDFFADSLTNFEIQFRNVFEAPSKIVIKTSGEVLCRLPSSFRVAEQSIPWCNLPDVTFTYASGVSVHEVMQQRENAAKEAAAAPQQQHQQQQPSVASAAEMNHNNKNTNEKVGASAASDRSANNNNNNNNNNNHQQEEKQQKQNNNLRVMCAGAAGALLALSVVMRVVKKN
eukprot:PhM_4_TR14825/c0_g1_i1/m.36525